MSRPVTRSQTRAGQYRLQPVETDINRRARRARQNRLQELLRDVAETFEEDIIRTQDIKLNARSFSDFIQNVVDTAQDNDLDTQLQRVIDSGEGDNLMVNEELTQLLYDRGLGGQYHTTVRFKITWNRDTQGRTFKFGFLHKRLSVELLRQFADEMMQTFGAFLQTYYEIGEFEMDDTALDLSTVRVARRNFIQQVLGDFTLEMPGCIPMRDSGTCLRDCITYCLHYFVQHKGAFKQYTKTPFEMSEYEKRQYIDTLERNEIPFRWFTEQDNYLNLTLEEFKFRAEEHPILKQIRWKFFDSQNVLRYEFGSHNGNYVMSFRCYDGHVEPLTYQMQVRNKYLTMNRKKHKKKTLTQKKITLDSGDNQHHGSLSKLGEVEVIEGVRCVVDEESQTVYISGSGRMNVFHLISPGFMRHFRQYQLVKMITSSADKSTFENWPRVIELYEEDVIDWARTPANTVYVCKDGDVQRRLINYLETERRYPLSVKQKELSVTEFQTYKHVLVTANELRDVWVLARNFKAKTTSSPATFWLEQFKKFCRESRLGVPYTLAHPILLPLLTDSAFQSGPWVATINDISGSLLSIDMSKCYPYCLSELWSVPLLTTSCYAERVEEDFEMTPGYYYVKVADNIALECFTICGWYSHSFLLAYKKLFPESNLRILFKIKCQKVIAAKSFNGFYKNALSVMETSNTLGLQKSLNHLIGIFNIRDKNCRTKTCYSATYDGALADYTDSLVRENVFVNKLENENGDELGYLTSSHDTTIPWKSLSHISKEVYDLSHVLLMKTAKRVEELGGRIVGVQTDCLHFAYDNVDLESLVQQEEWYGDNPGQFHIEHKSVDKVESIGFYHDYKKQRCIQVEDEMAPYFLPHESIPETILERHYHQQFNIDMDLPKDELLRRYGDLTRFLATKVLETDGNVLIEGDAGCGKSFLIKEVQRQLHTRLEEHKILREFASKIKNDGEDELTPFDMARYMFRVRHPRYEPDADLLGYVYSIPGLQALVDDHTRYVYTNDFHFLSKSIDDYCLMAPTHRACLNLNSDMKKAKTVASMFHVTNKGTATTFANMRQYTYCICDEIGFLNAHQHAYFSLFDTRFINVGDLHKQLQPPTEDNDFDLSKADPYFNNNYSLRIILTDNKRQYTCDSNVCDPLFITKVHRLFQDPPKDIVSVEAFVDILNDNFELGIACSDREEDCNGTTVVTPYNKYRRVYNHKKMIEAILMLPDDCCVQWYDPVNFGDPYQQRLALFVGGEYICRSDKFHKDLVNNEPFTITQLNEDIVTVKSTLSNSLSGGEELEIELSKVNIPVCLTLGYALTDYCTQSSTIHTPITLIGPLYKEDMRRNLHTALTRGDSRLNQFSFNTFLDKEFRENKTNAKHINTRLLSKSLGHCTGCCRPLLYRRSSIHVVRYWTADDKPSVCICCDKCYENRETYKLTPYVQKRRRVELVSESESETEYETESESESESEESENNDYEITERVLPSINTQIIMEEVPFKRMRQYTKQKLVDAGVRNIDTVMHDLHRCHRLSRSEGGSDNTQNVFIGWSLQNKRVGSSYHTELVN
tara:strand:- start:33 stop:4697 length:4665 start_codon:yes stop_codon:yes gene_type:complete